MQTVPDNAKTAWKAAIDDLEPFRTALICTTADGSSYQVDKTSMIDLQITRTLYDQASIGNCASAQMDLTYYPHPNGSGWAPAIGDKIAVYIMPERSVGTSSHWWCPQGVFFLIGIQTDAYTGVSQITAVDALTYYGDILYTDSYTDSTWLEGYQIMGRVCTLCNMTRGTVFWGGGSVKYYLSGRTCREVLQILAAMTGGNFTISNDNILYETLFHSYVDPVVIGRRAERISADGEWNGATINMTGVKSLKEQSDDGVAIIMLDSFATYSCGTERKMTFNVDSFSPGVYTLNNFINASGWAFNNGRKFKAFTAENVIYDPAIELGDAVSALGPQTSLLTDEYLQPLIEPDDTRITVQQPREYSPYWDTQLNSQTLIGTVAKMVVDYKTPQLAQLIQNPAPKD